MFTASSLLLLTLILNVQLCSPAPTLVQFSVAAEEPDLEDLEPAEGKRSVVPPSPEIAPTKADIGDPVFADPDEGVPKESAPDDILVAAPQESEDDAAWADASQEDTEVDDQPVDVESESPDQHHVEDPAQISPIRVTHVERSEDGAPEEHAEDEASPAQILLLNPDDSVEVELDASQEALPITLEEEKSAVLVPAETEVADRDQIAPEETAPVEPAGQDAVTEKQGDTVNIVSSDIKEVPQHKKEEEDAIDPVALEENTKEDPTVEEPEEESVVLFPVQFEDQVDSAAEETEPQESESEDPAVIVSVDSSEVDLEQEQAIEETIVFPDTDENAEVAGGDTEALVTVAPADLETNEEGQEEIETQESALDVLVLVDPASEDPDPEDLILIIPVDDPDEEVSEDYTGEIQSDLLLQEPFLEQDDNEPGDSDPYILMNSDLTETTSQTQTTVQDSVEEVPVTATEILTEASVEPVTSPAPAVTDAEDEIIPASVEGANVTDVTTQSDDFKAAGVLTEDESAGNRGAVLGAAFFTLVCFIIIGFVGVIVSKKLRRLHDTEVKTI